MLRQPLPRVKIAHEGAHRFRIAVFAVVTMTAAVPAAVQILRITDVNTTQIRALDRTKTVVFLTGAMMEGR
jgi:hypothetical protein